MVLPLFYTMKTYYSSKNPLLKMFFHDFCWKRKRTSIKWDFVCHVSNPVYFRGKRNFPELYIFNLLNRCVTFRNFLLTIFFSDFTFKITRSDVIKAEKGVLVTHLFENFKN